MLPFQTPFQELIQSLQLRLQEAEARETDLPAWQETCIRLCGESLLQLRQWVTAHAFPDRDCEIYFFKQVKPAIMARYIYYQKVYRLHTGYYNGSGLLEKERLEMELRAIARFFDDNRDFYTYYRNGYIHHDELFFIRGNYNWKLCPGVNHFDTIFSTSFDGKLAELMANELLMKYIDGMLNPSIKPADPTPANTALRAHHASLRCTASATDVVELGYALHAAGFFNNGKASIKEVMAFMTDAFKVDLRNFYHLYLRLRERKNPTKFLDELKSALLRLIENMDE